MGLDMYLIKNKDFGFGKEVFYWRKANAIHSWFVQNVQNGNDDCELYPVSKEKIQDLLSLCKKVVKESELIPGKVIVSYSFKNGKSVPNYEDGFVVSNPSVAKDILPTKSGFFFGSTEYDEYYVHDLKETIKACTRILKEFDFDHDTLYYHSSW